MEPQGRIVRVTTLTDDVHHPGSLSALVQYRGPQVIRFSVAGDIWLNERLTIRGDYVTIDGEDAPGPVAVRRFPVVVRGHHVTLRFLNIMVQNDKSPATAEGKGGGGGGAAGEQKKDNADALWVQRTHDVLLEHLTVLFGADETLSVTKSERCVVRYCLIGYSLPGPKKDHAFASQLDGGDIVFEYNVLVNNTSRNPGFGSGQFWCCNNLIANFGHRASYSSNPGVSFVAMTHNFYWPGPNTEDPGVFFRAPDKGSKLHLLARNNTFLRPRAQSPSRSVPSSRINLTLTFDNRLAVQNPQWLLFLDPARPGPTSWGDRKQTWRVSDHTGDTQPLSQELTARWQASLDYFVQHARSMTQIHDITTLLSLAGAYSRPHTWHAYVVQTLWDGKTRMRLRYPTNPYDPLPAEPGAKSPGLFLACCSAGASTDGSDEEE